MIKKQKKVELISQMQTIFNEADSVVVFHYKSTVGGLSVAEVSDLRRKAKDNGAKMFVTKNKLAQIALKNTKFEQLNSKFVGPTAIAYSKDPVAAAKTIVEFAKNNEKLVLTCASLNGKLLDVEQVKSLASLPSLDALRAMLIGLINAPATKIAGVLNAPGGKLARVLNAYATKE